MFQLIFSSSQLHLHLQLHLFLHLQLHLLLHPLADVVARRSHPKKGSEEPQKGERPRNTHDKPRHPLAELVARRRSSHLKKGDKPRLPLADVVARCSHVKKGS